MIKEYRYRFEIDGVMSNEEIVTNYSVHELFAAMFQTVSIYWDCIQKTDNVLPYTNYALGNTDGKIEVLQSLFAYAPNWVSMYEFETSSAVLNRLIEALGEVKYRALQIFTDTFDYDAAAPLLSVVFVTGQEPHQNTIKDWYKEFDRWYAILTHMYQDLKDR